MNIIDKIRDKQPLPTEKPAVQEEIEVTEQNVIDIIKVNKFLPRVCSAIKDKRDAIKKLDGLLHEWGNYTSDAVEGCYIVVRKLHSATSRKGTTTKQHTEKLALSYDELEHLINAAKRKELQGLVLIVKENLCTTCGEG